MRFARLSRPSLRSTEALSNEFITDDRFGERRRMCIG
jgi:hypothetical protein